MLSSVSWPTARWTVLRTSSGRNHLVLLLALSLHHILYLHTPPWLTHHRMLRWTLWNRCYRNIYLWLLRFRRFGYSGTQMCLLLLPCIWNILLLLYFVFRDIFSLILVLIETSNRFGRTRPGHPFLKLPLFPLTSQQTKIKVLPQLQRTIKLF